MADIGKAIIRLQKMSKGETAKIQSIIIHPNDTGFVKDEKTGKVIPAYFIESVKVEFNGEAVYEIKTGGSISKDPYFSYSLKTDKPGKLKMTWKDNKGGVFEQSADVTLA
ncbi:MAG: thiosulfate oxidation carrier complex protein SoxZ [Nitrospinae bacterium]|nr:thiosulfate oxidation carrier complex protein SoxZ [Nitrospinota bacterium]